MTTSPPRRSVQKWKVSLRKMASVKALAALKAANMGMATTYLTVSPVDLSLKRSPSITRDRKEVTREKEKITLSAGKGKYKIVSG